MYQNDWVRVIDAFFPVGDTTLYHTHDRDNVPICLAGGSMTTQPLAGTPPPETAQAGAVGFAPANPGRTTLPPPPGSLTWYEPRQPVHTPSGVEVIEIEIR